MKGYIMKIAFIFALLIAGACAGAPPYQSRDTTTTTATPSSATRDTSDCEREAALAGVGERAKAFENCMRARSGGAPKR
jgi:hypothetical protein